MLKTTPERLQELLDCVVQDTERLIQHMPGFVSASFHTSEDGTRVAEYVQWASQEAYEAARRTPDFRAHLPVVERIAEVDSHAYQVYRVVEAPAE